MIRKESVKIFRLMIPGFVISALPIADAVAETAYVTDQLRLGVHEAADTSDQAFDFLNSGDALEVITRQRSFVHVRLPDGRTGWVRRAFLIDEQPAAGRIAGVEAERDRLAGELAKLKESRDGRAERLEQLEQTVTRMAARAESAETELERLRTDHARDSQRLERLRFSVPASWALGAVLGALLLGVVGSWRWLDWRTRKRHGGFRIY